MTNCSYHVINKNLKKRLMFMMKKLSVLLLGCFVTANAYSAISMDRTRIIYNGDSNSVSLTVSNKNT